MKKILSLILLAALFATPALAMNFGNAVPFSNYSVADGNAHYSAVYNVRGFKTKTLTAQGVLVATKANSTYLPGTLAIQCGPTTTGPWSTCVANDYAQTAASVTSNTTFTWTDASAYIRASWTKSAAGLVKAWLNWTE